jgi:hypothetical protein
MLETYARAFGIVQATLVSYEAIITENRDDEIAFRNSQAIIRVELNTIRPHCMTLGLESSVRRIDRLLLSLYPVTPLVQLTPDRFRSSLYELRVTIDDELRSRLFLYVPSAMAELYEQPDLFGAVVHSKFGRASADIRSAGTCIALGQPTAAVFHLMCVLEVALDALSAALNLPYSQKNWEQILHAIEGETSKLTSRHDREFYSRAALEFKFFRDAWRNHTMHGRGRYDGKQAAEVFDHVKAFVVHLSSRLSERP